MGQVAIAAICLTLSSAAPLSSQTLLWEQFGIPDVTSLAPIHSGTVFLGDLDGDGFDDLVQIQFRLLPGTDQTEYWILSGRSGSTIDTVVDPTGNEIQGYFRLGDLDGDGVADFVRSEVSRDGLTCVMKVLSSRTRSLIWEVSGPVSELFGVHVNGEADLNGDGTPDLLLTARRADPQPGGFNLGAVYGYDGKDGSFLFRMNGTYPAFAFSIAHVGDIDGDGCDDFVVGGFEPGDRGGAFVHSGRTQELLGFGAGEFVGDSLGLRVVGCGDMTGDGIPEFAAGSDGIFTNVGLVRVFDGRTMEPLYSYRNPIGLGFGNQLRAGDNDFDLDGVPDLLVSSFERGPSGAGGTVHAFSGRDGEVLFTVGGTRAPTDPTRGAFGFGDRLTLVPPQPNDPFPRFAASQGYDVRFFRGRVASFSTRPDGVDLLGPGCVEADGPKMGMRRMDLGETTETTRIHLSNAPPGALALLVIGFSTTHVSGLQLPLNLDWLGLPNCNLRVSTDIVVPAMTGTSGNDAGYAFRDIPLPLAAQGGGQLQVHGQWVVLDMSNPNSPPISLSNALSWSH